MKRAPRLTPVVACGAALLLPIGAAAAPRAAGPPAKMFKSGYDLCKRASTADLSKAGGEPFSPGSFDGSTCTWSTSDGDYVVELSTHPPAYTATLSLLGRHGDKVSRVKVPGASKAVLDTFPFAKTHRYAKDLFAVYRRGVVQVSMNYKTPLATSKVIAVMKLVTKA